MKSMLSCPCATAMYQQRRRRRSSPMSSNSRFIWVVAAVCLCCSTVVPVPTPYVVVLAVKAPKYQRVAAMRGTNDNAVWPAGISEQDVEYLVTEVMNDATISIPMLPNAIERQIYRSTIKVCMNAIYHFLGDLQGKQLFGHEFRLGRWKGSTDSSSAGGGMQQHIHEQYQAFVRGDNIDEDSLEQIARRLLHNKAINQRFLPDAIERKLYVNCLKLVFRLLGMIAASLCIVVCGHEIRLDITKVGGSNNKTTSTMLTPAFYRAASSMTQIDKSRLTEFAIQAAIQEHELGGASAGPSDTNTSQQHRTNRNWMERMIDRRRQVVLVHVHAALFGLILGILDDLLANTRVELLSDRISFDIVPATDATTIRSLAQQRHKSRVQHVMAGIALGLGGIMAFLKLPLG